MVPHLDAVVSRITENAVIDVCLETTSSTLPMMLSPSRKKTQDLSRLSAFLPVGAQMVPPSSGSVKMLIRSRPAMLTLSTHSPKTWMPWRTGGGAEGQ